MIRLTAALAVAATLCGALSGRPRRIVIIKADGLPGDVLERSVRRMDPKTGRSELPWIDHVFFDGGTRVRNFYVRGISLSTPSWSMLDSGRHSIIRGNAEYDRFTLRVYDYLNFFPFYVGNARNRHADMPGVEVLDEAGIPLLIDRYGPLERYESPQLLQRGVKWLTLSRGARNRITSRSPRQLFDEWQTGFEFAAAVNEQVERELLQRITGDSVDYLDYFFTGYDHVVHLTNDEESLAEVLHKLDALTGRIWTAIEKSPRAADTIFVLLSDHGMNSDPGVYSQGFDLIRFFNSAGGGGHHVITNRHPLSEYKLAGLDPFVDLVNTPSAESLYLGGESARYPTVLLDLDGNERASVHLRNNTFNRLQMALQTVASAGHDAARREAARAEALALIEAHRASWTRTASELREELGALTREIARLRVAVAAQPKKFTEEQKNLELDNPAIRQRARLDYMEEDDRGYRAYAEALGRLLALRAPDLEPGRFHVDALIPHRAMGELNTIHDLQNYSAGPTTRIDYFARLAAVRVRNNVQAGVGPRPIDFIAARMDPRALPREVGGPATYAVFLYRDDQHEAVLLVRDEDRGVAIRYLPVAQLRQAEDGAVTFERREWAPGFPLQLFEDPNLDAPAGRATWLDGWHSDGEWLKAAHRTEYSNGIIGLAEHFSPLRLGAGFDDPLLRRLEERRRGLAQADLLLLASNHWNFNVRGFNPGGNHGSFLRASTLSTLMLAGAGIRRGYTIEAPYDSLSFVPTMIGLSGLESEPRPSEYPGRAIGELLR